jgi:hypothetical protein
MVFLEIFSLCRNIIFIAKIGKQINAFPLERRKLFHLIFMVIYLKRLTKRQQIP